MSRARLYLLALAVLSAVSLRADDPAANKAPDPAKLKPQGYLSDFAQVVDGPSRSSIIQYCTRFERATGVQIALVTIPTLADESIEDWSNRLFHNWGIGQKASNEGVMFLLVIRDKKSRIEVGYGLEQYLTDGQVGSILRSLRPQLEAGSYGAALLQASQQMGDIIAKGKGIELADRNPNTGYPPVRQRGFHQSLPIPFPVLMLLVFGVFMILSRIVNAMNARAGYGRGSSSYRRGGGGPGIFWGGGGGFGGFGGGGGGWGGGGDGGGGGGGFGGFGGGDSGGGGASGDW